MVYLRFFVVKTGAGEVESKELGSHHSAIGFEGERRDWLRSSCVLIASGFSRLQREVSDSRGTQAPEDRRKTWPEIWIMAFESRRVVIHGGEIGIVDAPSHVSRKTSLLRSLGCFGAP